MEKLSKIFCVIPLLSSLFDLNIAPGKGVQLHKLAEELGMTIHVCHFPPGTSKWNKIEHRRKSRIWKLDPRRQRRREKLNKSKRIN